MDPNQQPRTKKPAVAKNDELEDLGQSSSSSPANATAFQIEPNFNKRDYVLLNVDVGELFHDFQKRSTRLINDIKEKATLDTISSFMYVEATDCTTKILGKREVALMISMLF